MSEQKPETTPALTRGQKAAQTRAKNKQKKAVQASQKKSLPLSYLQDVLTSLDGASQELQGYAAIKSVSVVLVITHDGSEYEVKANHDGHDWTLDALRF